MYNISVPNGTGKDGNEMVHSIWFDMDGTLADLYGVENWLPKLEASDPSPYEEAKPLLRMATLARLLNKLIRAGWSVSIISWTSKNGSPAYNKAVAKAKLKWLKSHLKSVQFDAIDIIDYGICKKDGREGILFDDEMQNRTEWGAGAFDETNIIEILKGL